MRNTYLPSFILAAVTLSSVAGRTMVYVDDAPQTILSIDFQTAGPDQIMSPDDAKAAAFTTDPSEEVAGKRSLKGDSRGGNNEWNEFFHAKPGLFQPKEAYRVSFDYKILARSGNAGFYALFRRAGSSGKSADFTGLKADIGATGHAEMAFNTGHDGDYYLIIGIHNQGAMTVNDIVIQTDPVNRPVFADLPAPVRTWRSPGQTSYYVDSVHGDDAGDGRSAKHAWRSLDRVNAGEFGPGDKILLKAGSSWTGFLAPGGSGSAGSPIILTAYGNGPKPRIDAQGRFLAALYLHNAEQWEVSRLDIANKGFTPEPGLAGVNVNVSDFGTAHHISLKALDVHDVTGSNVKSEGGGSGITCACGGAKVKTRFDGLTIQDCHLQRTDRNGITMGGNWVRDATWYPSLHVIIRGNLLEDIGGDGIVPIGCDGAIIERNILRGGRMRAQDYAAGIWPWSCDNTVIQDNEVSGMKGTNDGEGYDSDYNCHGTLFQYNFSHDNDGGFMLICDDGSQHLPWNIGNSGTVIRYNISVDDGLHTFNITGPCRNTSIYNNVFYIGKGLIVTAVNGGNWGGPWPDATRFVNNIFYADGAAKFNFGGMTNTVFDSNVFCGNLLDRPQDAHALAVDPQLAAPGSMAAGGYALRPGSPCLNAGIPIAGNGGRDFWGRAVPANRPPNIGAY